MCGKSRKLVVGEIPMQPGTIQRQRATDNLKARTTIAPQQAQEGTAHTTEARRLQRMIQQTKRLKHLEETEPQESSGKCRTFYGKSKEAQGKSRSIP